MTPGRRPPATTDLEVLGKELGDLAHAVKLVQYARPMAVVRVRKNKLVSDGRV